jgi:hypothetical protein
MRSMSLWILAFGMALGACAKDPGPAIEQALVAGDLSQAQALLDQAVVSDPQRADLHALRYVLARHLALNGPAAGKDRALSVSIAEYEWLAAHFGLGKDYTNSDASLRAHGPALALLEKAAKSLYR